MMEKKSRARILRKNVHYPTYQLLATANSAQETPERQLIIGALTVLEWLRTKFQEIDIPEEFNMPAAEDSGRVQLSDLKSKRIDVGYTVETVCVPEEKVWAFRLAEPDLSTINADGVEVSTAVPGRIFETNIAFRVMGSAMQCGVKVVISEPEGTEAPCRVLRPAVVQLLASDPRLGLTCGCPLEEKMWELSSREKLKNLRSYLDSAMLPAVVFCDLVDKPEEQIPPVQRGQMPLLTPPGFDAVPILVQPPMLPGMGLPPVPVLPRSKPPKAAKPGKEVTRIPYNQELSRFLGARMGYMQSFHLPYKQFDSFKQLFGIEVRQGDVLFLEPKKLGGEVQTISYSEEEWKDRFDDLMDLSRDFLRKRSVEYGSVVFSTDARLLQMEQMKKKNLSVEDTVKLYEDQTKLLQSKHEEELQRWEEQLGLQTDKLNRLKGELTQSYDRARQDREEAEDIQTDLQIQLDQARDQIEYFKSWRARPKTPQEVPQWAEKRLGERLVLHSRAVKLLQGLAPNTIDIQLLCDALEYLSHEYWSQKKRFLTRDEADSWSSEKYGRAFKVVPSGESAINQFTKEYTVDYDDGNRSQKRALEEHLKTGNKAGFLLRIYFFYDSKNEKIVVGSLPGHLPTPTIG